MNITKNHPSFENRCLVLESWATYGRGKPAMDAVNELDTIGASNKLIKKISERAIDSKVRKEAKEILFTRLNGNIKRRIGIDLKKAKDLIEK